MRLIIHFKNNGIDTLCTGEYFGVYKNDVEQNNNERIIEMIKDEIDYYKEKSD